jgi:RNA polymerase sigma-70 factor (ECF subfamily)
MDDAGTINAVLTGDKERYSELVERYKRLVYAIAWSRLGDQDLAEDASQETFVKAYQYLGTLRQRGHFAFWIGKIARNVSVNLGRKRSRESQTAQAFATLANGSAGSVQASESEKDKSLWTAFAALPATHREALTLFYVEGKSVSESALSLGIGESAMKVRLHRARVALRQNLETSMEDSLAKLEPSSRFTGAVMAVLPISPIGVVNTAGFYAVAVKLGASLSFLLWMVLAQVAVGGSILWLSTKLEQAEFQNTPENAFRKKQVSATHRSTMFGFVPFMMLIFVGMPYLSARFGIGVIFKCLPLVFLPVLPRYLRTLRVNKSFLVWMPLVMMVVVTACCIAVGYFNAPVAVIFVMALAQPILMLARTSKTPTSRRDYNLFLRAVTDGFGDDFKTAEMPPELSDQQLKSFAQFLGARSFIQDYKINADGLSLVLVNLNHLPNAISNVKEHSVVKLRRDGETTVVISQSLKRAIENMIGSKIDDDEINSKVADALKRSIASVVAGDVNNAEKILTVKPDSEIFVQKRRGRSTNVMTAITLALLCVTLLMQKNVGQSLDFRLSSMRRTPLETIKGIPYTGFVYIVPSHSAETFSPVYFELPLLFQTTLSVDKRVNKVQVNGLKGTGGYTVTSTPNSVTIIPGGSIRPYYGIVNLHRTLSGFEPGY